MTKIHNMTSVSQYTIVSQNILKDENLSLKERGLLVTMLSLPDGWNFSIKGMAKILPDGIESISSTLNSLQDKGYVVSRQIKSENGRFGRNELELYDYPAHPRKKVSHMEKPCTGFPYTEDSNAEETDADKTCSEKQAQSIIQLQSNIQDQSNTNQSTKTTTEEVVVDESVIVLLRGLNLPDKDVKTLLKTANGDYAVIEQAVDYFRNYKKPVNNVTGFLKEAIVCGY